MLRDPGWREKLWHGGLLLILIHPLAWPMMLGYRKELVGSLRSGRDPLLPEWQGSYRRFLLEGFKAMGVIFGYLAPLYALLLTLLLSRGVDPTNEIIYGVVFFMCVPILSTLSLPAAITYWTFISPSYRLPLYEAVLFLAAFSLIIFFIPAAFLEVSKHGRYTAAFRVGAAARTISSRFVSYCFAWYRSSVMSLIGHLAFPFSPWGVVWCYLGIIYEFNAVLAGGSRPLEGSWFERLSCMEQIPIERLGEGWFWRCQPHPRGTTTFLLKLFGVYVPLPSSAANLLKLR